MSNVYNFTVFNSSFTSNYSFKPAFMFVAASFWFMFVTRHLRNKCCQVSLRAKYFIYVFSFCALFIQLQKETLRKPPTLLRNITKIATDKSNTSWSSDDDHVLKRRLWGRVQRAQVHDSISYLDLEVSFALSTSSCQVSCFWPTVVLWHIVLRLYIKVTYLFLSSLGVLLEKSALYTFCLYYSVGIKWI